MDVIVTKEMGKVELSCSHTFHFNCLTTWFIAQTNKNLEQTCPCCRQESNKYEMVVALNSYDNSSWWKKLRLRAELIEAEDRLLDVEEDFRTFRKNQRDKILNIIYALSLLYIIILFMAEIVFKEKLNNATGICGVLFHSRILHMLLPLPRL